MTTKPRIQFCDECEFDSGWHYEEQLDGSIRSWRPHLAQAQQLETARAIVEAAHEQQVRDARRIIAAMAETRFEFSANDCRDEMEAAGIDGPVIGAAFVWAQEAGLIVPTGRHVKHSQQHVRHKINLWRSVERARALGVSA